MKMKKIGKKLLVLILTLFMGISNVFAIPAHYITYTENEESEAVQLEGINSSGTIKKEGLFEYVYNGDQATLKLAQDANIYELFVDKSIDIEEGIFTSENRNIDMVINGSHTIENIGSLTDYNLHYTITGMGSITLNGYYEPYTLYVGKFRAEVYDETTGNYVDYEEYIAEDGKYILFIDPSEFETLWPLMKEELLKTGYFRYLSDNYEDHITFETHTEKGFYYMSEDWVQEHITTDLPITYTEGSVTIGNIPLESIQISNGDIKLENIGDTKKLEVIYNPTDTTDNKTIIWESSNEKVATVDSNGNVKAISNGITTITATAQNGLTSSITVKVGNFLKGDMNTNGSIEIADALEALYYVSGKKELTPEKLEIGDMNNDGKLEIIDALEILKVYKNS